MIVVLILGQRFELELDFPSIRPSSKTKLFFSCRVLNLSCENLKEQWRPSMRIYSISRAGNFMALVGTACVLDC